MKQLLLFLVLFSAIFAYGQCTIDNGYTQPGIYPDPLPDGYAGQPYDEDITFVMPLDTSGATINNFEIVSIALPVGLNWECSNAANGCNYNPQNDPYGCIQVTGIPLVAGVYDVEVSILVDVTASGQNIDNIAIPFFITLTIQTPEVGNSGFSPSPGFGCVPLEVEFTNNNPGLLHYQWDFGNGQTTNDENPSVQTYTEPGAYPVQYAGYNNTDTVDTYTLTEVTILNVGNNWLGEPWGWELLNGNAPDPYFKLMENGSLLYQSSYEYNNSGPITWPVNISLNPANEYKIKVMDADEMAAQTNAAEITYGADDNCGAHIINLNGCGNCDAGDYSDVAYSITYEQIYPVPSVQSLDTIFVENPPGIPNVVYDSLNYQVYTDSSQYTLQWTLDTAFWTGHTNAIEPITQSGNYSVTAYNSLGCSTTSDTIFAVYCDSSYAFDVSISAIDVLYVSDVPFGYNVSWILDGNPIPGSDDVEYTPTQNGDYVAVISDEFGCQYFTPPYNYYNDASILEHQKEWWCYPNPAQEQFVVMWPQSLGLTSLQLHNTEGKLMQAIEVMSSPQLIDVSTLSNGLYILSGKGEKGTLKKRVLVRN